MTPPPRLQVDSLVVALDGRVLLSGFDVTLAAGDFVAVVGESGVGKTSLLRTIAGLAAVGGGSISFEERGAAEIGWPAFRRRVVMVQQQPAVLNDTVRANLERPFAYRAANGGLDLDRAIALLTRLKLPADVLSTNATKLSVGQQQRVCLVRALLVEPAVLLLDEPCSALDEAATAAVEQLLIEQGDATGLAALVATHDRAQAARLCDRIIELRRVEESVHAAGA